MYILDFIIQVNKSKTIKIIGKTQGGTFTLHTYVSYLIAMFNLRVVYHFWALSFFLTLKCSKNLPNISPKQ